MLLKIKRYFITISNLFDYAYLEYLDYDLVFSDLLRVLEIKAVSASVFHYV